MDALRFLNGPNAKRAVVTGRFFGKGRYKGSPLDERQRFTSVWIKRNGRWQGISEHGSKLNPPDDQ
jgi:ketosteroid isomerase-like protein